MAGEGAQRKMPLPRQSFLAGRALSILLAGPLVFSTHLLWAQKSPPREQIQLQTSGRQLAPIPEATSHPGTVPETLPEAPRSQTESREKLFHIRYHYALIDTQAALNLRQPTRTAELPGEYFPSRASSQWLTPVYGTLHHPTIQPTDLLQYYGRHVPGAIPTILRVSQQVKAHPQVTGVLKLFTPQF